MSGTGSGGGVGGASYLPIFINSDEQKQQPPPRQSQSSQPQQPQRPSPEATTGGNGGNSGRDPLYAALLGGKIGSSPGMPTVGGHDYSAMNTLDEPVSETIKRDLQMVGNKAWAILTFGDPEASLRDLWGPLINSLLLGVILALNAVRASPVSIFTLAMTLCWLGGALVAVNLRLLGYRIALLPALAFCGYSLAPLTLGAMIKLVIPRWLLPARLLIAGGSLLWSLTAAIRQLEVDPALEDRRILACYPFSLFYGSLAWIMLVY